MNKKEWFKLEDVTLDTSSYNDFTKLKESLELANTINKDSWYLSYIKVQAKLTFMGKLNTPNGEVETEFTYYIKTNYTDLRDEAKVTIYEQTFTGLNEAVTIRFSSGSIISKIVFGDIEKCYLQLKDEVKRLCEEYNIKVKEFNEEIKKLQNEDKESEK